MSSIFTRKALQACIVCAWSSIACGAFGERALPCAAFTNHAGHVVVGRLTAISNNVAVISGRVYPLAIFPDAEQARMRDLLQVPSDLPPALAKRRRALRERYLRNEALLKAGAKTSEAADRLRADLESAWRHALGKADIDRATRDYWLSRLLD